MVVKTLHALMMRVLVSSLGMLWGFLAGSLLGFGFVLGATWLLSPEGQLAFPPRFYITGFWLLAAIGLLSGTATAWIKSATWQLQEAVIQRRVMFSAIGSVIAGMAILAAILFIRPLSY